MSKEAQTAVVFHAGAVPGLPCIAADLMLRRVARAQGSGSIADGQAALDRLSEISLLAQDATKTITDLSNYTVEFSQLQNYLSDITSKTFNGVNLFGNTVKMSAV